LAHAKSYPLFVDTRTDSSAQAMMDDLARGDIDCGILWGPMAGYYAGRANPPLVVVPLVKEKAGAQMTYRIGMGVRQSAQEWNRRAIVSRIIARRRLLPCMAPGSSGPTRQNGFGAAGWRPLSTCCRGRHGRGICPKVLSGATSRVPISRAAFGCPIPGTANSRPAWPTISREALPKRPMAIAPGTSLFIAWP